MAFNSGGCRSDGVRVNIAGIASSPRDKEKITIVHLRLLKRLGISWGELLVSFAFTDLGQVAGPQTSVL